MLKGNSKWLILGLVILLMMVFLAALSFGAADISLREVKGLLLNEFENENTIILKEMRLPRVVAAALSGMALAVAGAYMQGMTRNPLASPSLFGITAGASALLSFSIVFFKTMTYYHVLFVCLIGSMVAGGLVFAISNSGKQSLSNQKTVLAGAAVSTMLYALSDAIALSYTTSKQMTMWANSGLIGVTFNEIYIVLPVIIIGLLIAVIYGGKLTLISIDEEIATSLGENVKQLKTIFFFLVTLLTGAAIALSGSIVFVGLIVPHFVRKLVGSDYKVIVPVSIFVGAMVLMVMDLLSRTINAPYETSISAIMAICSYPLFLYVVKRKGGR